MVRHNEKRLARLEAAQGSRNYRPPQVVVMRVGETHEEAVLRIYGADGLPPRQPGEVPHIFVQPVSPEPRDARPGSPPAKAP